MEDALKNANELDFNGLKTRVFRVEHLMAIALQTGRNKDLERVAALKAAAGYDDPMFKELLDRFQLRKKWEALP